MAFADAEPPYATAPSPPSAKNADPERHAGEDDVTEVLARAARGDPAAVNALIPKVYASLRRLAHGARVREREGAHTLETTALVHEAYLTLARGGDVAFADREHLYAYMGRVMRHLLIDRARHRNARKRQAPPPTTADAQAPAIDLLALDQALARLAAQDARLARVAELRLFADLTSAQIGEVTGVNARTVERDWLKARAFLCACLEADA